MKRAIIGVLAALLLIAGSGIASAEEKTEIEAGVKMWYNDWESKTPVGTITSDSTMLLGPAVGFKFPNHLFLDASFLFSTSDYKFSEAGEKWSRQDIDLIAGFMVTDAFGLLAGYKNSAFKEQETGDKETVYGPLIGAVVDAPVDEVFSIYGNLDYLFTKFKLEGTGAFTEDSPGWIVEAGVKYAFTPEFLGSLGYKYESTKGKDSDVTDTFTGLTLGLFYSF